MTDQPKLPFTAEDPERLEDWHRETGRPAIPVTRKPVERERSTAHPEKQRGVA